MSLCCNRPQIKLGLPGAAGENPPSARSPAHLQQKHAVHGEKHATATYPGGLLMLLAAVFGLGSTTVGVYGTRRTDGEGDAVEAGRHPPADGRTPETATQRAVVAAYRRSMPEKKHPGAPNRAPAEIKALPEFV